MKYERSLEQHIAVFGQSGSGKTVLLSSFYGPTQEPAFHRTNRFTLAADDLGQGSRLLNNYLGMRDAARLPASNHFNATRYGFSLRLNHYLPKAARNRRFDTLKLVWHDYPGEWFEQEVSGPEEAARRIDTFRSLLVSDVALLLVDGQRLLDYAGEEERYLKSLFITIRNALLALKNDLLAEGQLSRFPRVWVIALSKADLLPAMDVWRFRDLLITMAHEEMTELREVLQGMLTSPEAFSFGEDFMLLSSAKFETTRGSASSPGGGAPLLDPRVTALQPGATPGGPSVPGGLPAMEKIDVTRRIGLDLILPVATILPLERIARWLRTKRLAANALGGVVGVLGGVLGIAAVLVGKLRKFVAARGPVGLIVGLLANAQIQDLLTSAADLGEKQLRELKEKAEKEHDDMTAMMTEFRLALWRGGETGILLRSRQ